MLANSAEQARPGQARPALCTVDIQTLKHIPLLIFQLVAPRGPLEAPLWPPCGPLVAPNAGSKTSSESKDIPGSAVSMVKPRMKS